MIEVLVGTIACGKSTYAKRLAKSNYLVVNDDFIVNLIHAGDYTLYDKNLKSLYKSIENHIVNFGVEIGRNVVIDRGVDIRRKSRARWIALANSLDTPIFCTVFPMKSPAIHAERRYNSDRRGLSYEEWLKVAKSHISEYEEPKLEEGFSGIFYF